MVIKNIKLVVIGGASSYTPELIEGLIQQRDQIDLRELTLVDTRYDRLQMMGGMVQRMFDHADYRVEIELSSNRKEALIDADFVITQIRVGGMSARLLDETIPPRYGVIGQETVGPGGFANALRTIPVMLDIAQDIEAICPDAWLINFANPSGVVTEAILKYTNLKAIGLCNIPTHLSHTIAEQQNVSPEAVILDYFGINHLSWVRDVTINGQSQMEKVLDRYIDFILGEENPLFSRDLMETLGMIPSYYLSFYYNHARMLAEQIQGPQTRAERVMEIEEALFRLYSDDNVVEKPDLLSERGGRYYSVAAVKLIGAICNDANERHILNVRNQDTFSCLPSETVVEVPCVVNATGAHPMPIDPIPLQAIGLMTAVKTSEQLTIKAAVSGDQQLALQALMNHPLVPSFEVAQSLLAVLLAENSDYLPRFALDSVLQL